MKSILSILLMGLVTIMLFSCSNTPIKVDNPKKETTIQIQQLATIDSIYYKIVEVDDKVYIVKDGLVVKKVVNDSGAMNTLTILIISLVLILNVIGIIAARD